MKKIIALLLSVCLLLVLTACDFNKISQKVEDGLEDAGALTTPPKNETTQSDPTGTAPTEDGKATFTVIVVHKDGKSKTFTYTTEEEFVGTVLEAEGLIQGNAGPYGMEITHVDGEKAVYTEDKAYWAVYEGEEYALQGIDTTPVVDGRTYKLVYTNA